MESKKNESVDTDLIICLSLKPRSVYFFLFIFVTIYSKLSILQ